MNERLAIRIQLEPSADFLLPVLNNLVHYTDWLDKHPFQYIKASEKLNERE
jgi:hypothetical protein